MKFLCIKHIIIIEICYYVVNKLLYIVLEFIYNDFKLNVLCNMYSLDMFRDEKNIKI